MGISPRAKYEYIDHRSSGRISRGPHWEYTLLYVCIYPALRMNAYRVVVILLSCTNIIAICWLRFIHHCFLQSLVLNSTPNPEMRPRSVRIRGLCTEDYCELSLEVIATDERRKDNLGGLGAVGAAALEDWLRSTTGVGASSDTTVFRCLWATEWPRSSDSRRSPRSYSSVHVSNLRPSRKYFPPAVKIQGRRLGFSDFSRSYGHPWPHRQTSGSLSC